VAQRGNSRGHNHLPRMVLVAMLTTVAVEVLVGAVASIVVGAAAVEAAAVAVEVAVVAVAVVVELVAAAAEGSASQLRVEQAVTWASAVVEREHMLVVKEVAVVKGVETRSSEAAVRTVRSNLHFLHLIPWMAVLVEGRQRMPAEGIVDSRFGAVVAVMEVADRHYWEPAVQDWDMVVRVAGIALEVGHRTVFVDRRRLDVVVDSHLHTAIAAGHRRLKALHFLCSSSRLYHLVRRIVCLGTDSMVAVVRMEDDTWHSLDCMCLTVFPRACDRSIEQR